MSSTSSSTIASIALTALVVAALIGGVAATPGAALSASTVQGSDGPTNSSGGSDGPSTDGSSDESGESGDESNETSVDSQGDSTDDESLTDAERRRRQALQDDGSDEPQQQDDSQRTERRDSEPQTVIREVTDRMRVVSVDWHPSNETMIVGLANVGQGTSKVTLTERVKRGQSRSFGVEQVNVDPGETVRVSVDVRPDRGVGGVMITTQRSIEQGTGTYIERGDADVSLFSGSAEWSDVRAAGAFGVLVSGILLVLIAWHIVARRHEDVKEVDLDV